MRNYSIERTFNHSILSISDYLLQMFDQAKIQKQMDKTMLNNRDMKKSPVDHSLLSKDEREEADYELYYVLIKKYEPELFVKGDPIETFSVDKNKSSFQVLHDNGKFFGVYKQESKEAHRVTQVFHSKEEVLLNMFGTASFERFRGHTFFQLKDGRTYSLKDNTQFRLNLINPFKPQHIYENIEKARSFVIKDELKNDLKVREKAIHRTLIEYQIPLDLMGKTVMIKSMYKDEEGVRISLVENETKRDIRILDLSEKWMERIRGNPGIKAAFDELIRDSRSIGEGFLAFYGIELNKELQIRQYDLVVITNEEGPFIGKSNGNGMVNKLSTYFSEKEANAQLEKFNVYLQLEKQKENLNNKVEINIEFIDLSEKA